MTPGNHDQVTHYRRRKPHRGVRAICLGNGCFPYGFPRTEPKVPVRWLDTHRSDDPDYPGGHTFAVLRLSGPRIDFEFVSEAGDVLHTETWA